MPHKRSRSNRLHRLQREEDYHQIKQLRSNERRDVWFHAFYDHIMDEVVNRLKCEWVPIDEGEVLVDSRLRGAFQRIG